MIERLFKGKRKDTGEWTEGYFFKIWDRVFLLWGMTGDSPNMEEVIPETVEQCTGLSKKVEEIKKALQDHSIEKLKYQDGIKFKELDFFDILTYINELESENERLNKSDTSKEESSIEYYNLYRDFKRENQKLKDRIAELEKENKSKTDTITDLLKNQEFYETEKLKQFAEKLKKRLNLGLYKWQYAEVDSKTIDEVLKEYIDEE